MARLGETGDGAPSVSAVSGFESDLADLIDDHVRACGGDLSFDAFRARWQSRSFSFVHNARLVELREGEYAQMLFSATMPYLAPDAGPTVRRIAALYALHLLYHTQQLAPRARVYVTPRDVRRLAQLVETCVEMGAADAVRAVKELVDDHAFAERRVRPNARGGAGGAAAAAAEATAGASSGRPKKRKAKGTHTRDAVRGAFDRTASPAAFPFPDDDEDDDDDDEARRSAGGVSDEEARAAGETENPAEALRARVAAASRGALEHLRATRVPGSFQALAEDSTKYGACMAALTRRGGGSKSEEGGLHARRVETRTAEMHELVRRQVVKYDSKLRAALRPETAEPRHPHRDVLDVLDPSADAATGLCEGPSGQTKTRAPGPGRLLGRSGTYAGWGSPRRRRGRCGTRPGSGACRTSRVGEVQGSTNERFVRVAGSRERSARAAGSARRATGRATADRRGTLRAVLASASRTPRTSYVRTSYV